MTIPAQDGAPHFWYRSESQRTVSVGVLEALRSYRTSDVGMRRRSQLSMSLGENDLQAIRFIVRAAHEHRFVGPKALAEYLGVSSASTSVLLDRLALAGLVGRVPSEVDRRAMVLVPTPLALSDLSDNFGGLNRRITAVTETLSPDEAQVMVDFLGAMGRAVGQEDATAVEAGSSVTASAPASTAEELRSAVVGALSDYGDAEESMRNRTRTSMKMGASDMQALRFLLKAQGQQRIVAARDIAEYLQMSSASVTAMLDRLSLSGHIRREPHPTSRRSIRVVVTEDSASRVREVMGSMHRRMMDVAAALTDKDARSIVRFYRQATIAMDSSNIATA